MSPSDTATSPPRFRNQPEKNTCSRSSTRPGPKPRAPAVVMGTNNVAQIQAEQLLDDCVLSHWGTDGPQTLHEVLPGRWISGQRRKRVQPQRMRPVGYMAPVERGTQAKMVAEAVEGLLESPGHRETMLDSSYSKVNIGLAWSRNTFKAVQHFEGDYVEITRTPTIQAGKLTLEGRLTSGNEFDSRYPIYALLVYDPNTADPNPRATGQDLLLLIRRGYNHIIPPSHTLGDRTQLHGYRGTAPVRRSVQDQGRRR